MLKENIWIFFVLSLIFAVEMWKIYTRIFISMLALVFLLSHRTQINGGKEVVLI